MPRCFEPPTRLLMGCGPAELSPRVLAATARPPLGRSDPAWAALSDEVRGLAARAFRAPDHAGLVLPGSGTAAAEAALLSLLEPGDVAVVAVNGLFSARLATIAERAGAEVVRVEHPWGRPVDAERVEAALWARGAKLLAFAQAETSTGVRSDPAVLCALAREHGALSVVDCVSALGGIAVDAAEWDADLLYAAPDRCLSAPSGTALLAVGRGAGQALAARRSAPVSWLHDLSRAMAGEDGDEPTAPAHAVYGLHEALLALFEEGLEAAITRHRRMHEALAAGAAALGLNQPVAPERRLPQVVVLTVPEGVDAARVVARMRERFGVEIGPGLGPTRGRVWRVGLMGAAATPRHVRAALVALADALAEQAHPGSVRDALVAADAVLV